MADRIRRAHVVDNCRAVPEESGHPRKKRAFFLASLFLFGLRVSKKTSTITGLSQAQDESSKPMVRKNQNDEPELSGVELSTIGYL